jgi:hypothetical protein
LKCSSITSCGKFDIDLPNLTYSKDKKNLGMKSDTQIKSEGFDTASSGITVNASTSNASISIRNN